MKNYLIDTRVSVWGACPIETFDLHDENFQYVKFQAIQQQSIFHKECADYFVKDLIEYVIYSFLRRHSIILMTADD